MLSIKVIAYLVFGVFHSNASPVGQFGRRIIVDLDDGTININQDYPYGDIGFDQDTTPPNEGVVGVTEGNKNDKCNKYCKFTKNNE